MLFSHRDLVPRLRLGTKSLGALKACTNLYMVNMYVRIHENCMYYYTIIIHHCISRKSRPVILVEKKNVKKTHIELDHVRLVISNVMQSTFNAHSFRAGAASNTGSAHFAPPGAASYCLRSFHVSGDTLSFLYKPSNCFVVCVWNCISMTVHSSSCLFQW